VRHQKTGRKLGRNSTERRALFRNMVTSLILEGRITTTDAKAKELRRYADRIITLGKRQTLAARRRAARFVRTDAALAKLFNDLAPLFAKRAGGYTRIVKVGIRRGDAAPLAMVELTEQLAAPKVEEPAAKGKDAKAKKDAKPKKGAKAKATVEAKPKRASRKAAAGA
jgi:large subunit ribosomal protein L17